MQDVRSVTIVGRIGISLLVLIMLRIALLMSVIFFAGCARSPEQLALSQANKLLDEGQIHAASDTVEDYLQKHPDSAAFVRMRVVILLRVEKPDLAAVALQRVPDGNSFAAELLRHHDRIVRENAAKLVASQPNPDDFHEIARAVEDSDPELRRYCARALGELGNPAALKPLFRLLSDDNWFVRAEAAIALGKIGDTRAIGWLVQLLQDPDGYVRYSATTALYDLATPSSHPLLLRSFLLTSPAQQFGLAVALARLHDPAALAPLANSFKNNDVEIRRRAVEALGECGLSEGTNALAPFLMDPDPGVRAQAQKAIDRLHGHGKT
jgi:HEAT repeat protein